MRAAAAGESGDERAAHVAGTPTRTIRRITTITPMFNEADHVQQLVADIAAQDFDGELEVLVADGGSTDGSREVLTAAAARGGVEITLIENPARWVAPALNACIRRATGDLIVRLDCHTRYPPDYLRRCAEASAETGAWSVGGVVVPRGRTSFERAIACATDSPFGGVHWSRHNAVRGRVEVDVAYCGAFQPIAFERAGLFDEGLVRNQDDELTLRLRRAGGRIVLDPEIRAYYTPRGSRRSALRQYYEYGFWKVPVMLKHRRVASGRSLAPLAFVASLAALAAAAPFQRSARQLLAAEVAVYALASVGFGAASTRRRGESWRLLPQVASVFPVYHVGYGAGLLHGAAVALRSGLAGFDERSRKPR